MKEEHEKTEEKKKITRRKLLKYGILGFAAVVSFHLLEPVRTGSHPISVRALDKLISLAQLTPGKFSNLNYPGQGRVLLPMFSPEGDYFVYTTYNDYEEYKKRGGKSIDIQTFKNNIRISTIDGCLIRWIDNKNLAIFYIEHYPKKEIMEGLSIDKVIDMGGLPLVEMYNVPTGKVQVTLDTNSLFPFLKLRDDESIGIDASPRTGISVDVENPHSHQSIIDSKQHAFCYTFEGKIHHGFYGYHKTINFGPLKDIEKYFRMIQEKTSTDISEWPDSLKILYTNYEEGYRGRIYEAYKVRNEVVTRPITPNGYDFSMPTVSPDGRIRAVYGKKHYLSGYLENILVEAKYE